MQIEMQEFNGFGNILGSRNDTSTHRFGQGALTFTPLKSASARLASQFK